MFNRYSKLLSNTQKSLFSMAYKNFAYKVVLIRHGQSAWNLENRFTGWYDVDLTKQGNINFLFS